MPTCIMGAIINAATGGRSNFESMCCQRQLGVIRDLILQKIAAGTVETAVSDSITEWSSIEVILSQWNNYDGRTVEEVYALLDEAAELHPEMQATERNMVFAT